MKCLSIQRSSCLPDENNVVALQEEVKQMKLRELETLRSFREMQDTVTELNQRWQVTHTRTHTNHYCVSVKYTCVRDHVLQLYSSRRVNFYNTVSAASYVPWQQHWWWGRPLEGIPKEERHERAAGQTDDSQTEGGPGPS